MLRKFIYIILGVSCISFLKSDIKTASFPENIPTEVIAGEQLRLEFANCKPDDLLILQNSYGTTLLKPNEINNSFVFDIPQMMTVKRGIMKWKYLKGNSERNGEINVLAQGKPELIETYFGPRSIQAGERDYSMLVAIPTDKFDNPLEETTPVKISEFFKGDLQNGQLGTKNLIAWKNVFSKNASGKITVTAASKGIQTQEMISEVYPSHAQDFEIELLRDHDFADGNSVAGLRTSVLKDEFGNIVSDGTLVEFFITDTENNLLKTTASSINGVATAQFLHPEIPGDYQFQAVIKGIAESTIIRRSFQASVTDFEISWDAEKSRLVVGPVYGFMGQLIPDGLRAEMKSSSEVLKTEQSQDGRIIFNLNEKEIQKKNFEIRLMGITKTIKINQHVEIQ